MMKRALVFATLLTSIPCAPAGADSEPAPRELPLSLTIRQELPSGLEQVSVVFREDRVELVLNSNFAGHRDGKIRLGHFEAPFNATTERLRELLTIERAKLTRRAEFREGLELPPPAAEPHRRKVLVGNEELFDGNVEQELDEAIREIQAREDWTPIDGVELVPDAKKGVLTITGLGKNREKSRTVPFKDVPCEIRPHARDFCVIADYGSIYLD